MNRVYTKIQNTEKNDQSRNPSSYGGALTLIYLQTKERIGLIAETSRNPTYNRQNNQVEAMIWFNLGKNVSTISF